ncbi:hypothetical protein BSKO_01489 [Bryopsis sp. KO-2023]|nr:hypothetical protein BSKO_01489 [Bryopsis sp. KO-2023]
MNALDGVELEHGKSGQPTLGRTSRTVRQRARKLQSKKHKQPEVTCYRDIVWQKEPDKLLKYRPFLLHYYGWVPFLILRNVKATVFSDLYLHIQTTLLLVVTATFHLTGFGIPNEDLASFVRLFGTSYSGAIFNASMIITFILGFFTTLVINRWSGVRAAYGRIISATLDLSMTLSHVMHNELDWRDPRTRRARTELIRLLNLGHVLVVTSADAQNDDFKRSKGVKTYFRYMVNKVRKNTPLENAGNSFFDGRRARDVSYVALVQEGLVNPDEWKLLEDGEEQGMPSYQTVYYWAQSMLHKCKAAEFVINGPQMLPILMSKLNSILESASQVMTSVNSQMPYPYVNLVSFVAHSYLLLCAIWFGSFLRVGYPGSEAFFVEGTAESVVQGTFTKSSTEIKGNPFTAFFCYLLVALASILFQGLLNMHSLLDNPFGSHCAMFPLRQHVSELMNSTRAMLKLADKLPGAFVDVFKLNGGSDSDEEDASQTPKPIHTLVSRKSAIATFMHPSPLTRGISVRGANSTSSIPGFGDTSLADLEEVGGTMEDDVSPENWNNDVDAIADARSNLHKENIAQDWTVEMSTVNPTSR